MSQPPDTAAGGDPTAASLATLRQSIRNGFSCRQKELDLILALLHRTLLPAEMTAAHWETLKGAGEVQAGERSKVRRPLVFVGGRSGMGKSRLLTEARAIALQSEVRVKEIWCHERQGTPFLPILRVVKGLVAESSSRARLWHRYGYVLTRVFPELAEELGAARNLTELPGDDGKIQLFDALSGILTELSRERPHLLLIHDLHRSDPGTVDFLEFLARNVYLDDVAQQRDLVPLEGDGSAEGDDDWKEIGSRTGRTRKFITDGLIEAEGWIDIDGPATRLMVIANYRESTAREADETPEARVLATIERLRNEPYVSQLSLPALSRGETGSLVERTLGGGDVSPRILDRIHSATGGNPFFAVEICRSLLDLEALHPREESSRVAVLELHEDLLESVVTIPDSEPTTAAGPESAASGESAVKGDEETTLGAGDREERLARHLMRLRMKRLDATERCIVRALAALRRPVHVAFLERLLGVPREDIRAALVSLQDRSLVSVLPIHRKPLFFLGNEAYTRAIYNDLDPEERTDLHHRIGRALTAAERASEPVRVFEIYEHMRCSSSPRECLEFGLSAARYFARAYALDTAAKIYADLLALLASEEDRPLRLELLAELSELELRRGQHAAAKGHAKRLLEEGGADLGSERRLETYVHLSEIYRRAGEPLKGIKFLNRALKHCEDAIDERVRARLSGLLGELRLERQDPKRAINLSMRGLKELDGVEEADRERALLLGTLARAHLAKGEMVAAVDHYQRLLELVEKLGDEAKMAHVLSTLGRVYYDRGNYFRAARYLFRALDVVRRLQDVRALSRAYDELGKVYRNSGDHLRGLEYFNRSLRLRERIGDLEGLSPTLNSLGSLYAHMGSYYQAIRYFKRSVKNSERFGDTAGIVRAFLHLGWAYYEIGELRQVESLCRQILILSQEFNLTTLEGEGHRLHGNLLFVRGDRKEAERKYRKAIETASRRGRKNSEAAATLDLGALLAEKEAHEAALKLISKGQLLAEEIQSTPLQARAYLLKGDVYRFLKGGNQERAKEAFRRGLELVSGENQLPFMWELDYSIAKVFQANREFIEAGESYRRAESILEGIAERLPEDMKVVYYDDRRRKVFYEDYRRFEKEASGRPLSAAAELPGLGKDDKVWRLPAKAVAAEEPGAPRHERLFEVLVRVGWGTSPREWAARFLEEARRLVPSPSGYLLRARDGGVTVMAASEMGPEEEWAGEQCFPGAIGNLTIRHRAAFHSGDATWAQRLQEMPGGSGYKNRSILTVPLIFSGKVLGALYLERPSARNPFSDADKHQLERFFAIALGQLVILERLWELEHYKGTPLLTRGAFDLRLEELVHAHFSRGKRFFLVELFAPGLDRGFGPRNPNRESFAPALIELGGPEALFCAHAGDDGVIYGFSGDGINGVEDLQRRIRTGADELLVFKENGIAAKVKLRVIRPERTATDEEDLLRSVRGEIQFCRGDFPVDAEIDRLTAGDLSLKEAKTALEKRYITAELLKSRGNITRAAESLGVHRPQLSNLIKKHNVRREDFE